MSWTVQNDLIFDLGLHTGEDADYFLRKGFRVVGLEAVPELAERSRKRLAPWGNRITVVNKALYHERDIEVSFYTVPDKNDWGSLDRAIAEKATYRSVEIRVPTIDLSWLFDAFGVPRYIKCDMEGGDIIFREQLLAEARRPAFVSLEMNDGREGEIMAACGYEVGQIVNQWMHPFKRPPNPAREGEFAAVTFNGEMSGSFGLELPAEKWIPLGDVGGIYRRWKDLRDIDQELAPGWVDLHVTRREALA